MSTSGMWRKSSRSGSNGGACVELARTPSVTRVRDSKNPAGPLLVVPPASLDAFLAAARDDRFF